MLEKIYLILALWLQAIDDTKYVCCVVQKFPEVIDIGELNILAESYLAKL
jgi:hypothetical protein